MEFVCLFHHFKSARVFIIASESISAHCLDFASRSRWAISHPQTYKTFRTSSPTYISRLVVLTAEYRLHYAYCYLLNLRREFLKFWLEFWGIYKSFFYNFCC